jgi:hypothetical protein
MRHDALPTSDHPRAFSRWSVTRRLWCDSDLPAEVRNALNRGDVERVLFSSTPLQVKDRCVVARHDYSGGSLLIKRHTWGNLWRTVRMAFREPAARRSARLGAFLHSRGIPTPRPLAYLEHRFGPWAYRSYLVSDYEEGTSLYNYIRFGSQSAEELREVAQQVARIWQQLVELGISHSDMKPENFIVNENLSVSLIDLERMCVGGKAARLRRRQLFDVQNFLHIRGWHNRLEARSIFAEAFLNTPSGEYLRPTGVERIAQFGNDGTEIDATLSVLIMCDGGIKLPLARKAIDSVQDIGDEIVLVEQTSSGGLKVLKRIDVCNRIVVPDTHNRVVLPLTPQVTRSSWALVLRQNECVTPFLAKELQQRICDEGAGDAFRIPIERQYFGRSIWRRKSDPAPNRLFRQTEQSFAIDSNVRRNDFDPNLTARLTGVIEECVCDSVADYIDELNGQTSRAASARWQSGESPRLGRAIRTVAWQFTTSYLGSFGIRSGWIGLQISVLDAVFRWIEEAKLRQLSAAFQNADGNETSDEEPSLFISKPLADRSAHGPKSKAA